MCTDCICFRFFSINYILKVIKGTPSLFNLQGDEVQLLKAKSKNSGKGLDFQDWLIKIINWFLFSLSDLTFVH